jgi:PKD repeat protein
VTFTASNALSGTASTVITVNDVNRNPVVTAPATRTVNEGDNLTFTVSATDPDGDHVTLTAPIKPISSSFVDNGDNTGTFSWRPTFDQAGEHTATFVGNDGKGGTGSASTTITVMNVNRAPTADAGGPYNGVTNIPVAFDGSGSTDPDGDALTYDWDFGDGGSSTEVMPMHAYTAAGLYFVTLTVTDPGPLSDSDSTTATISDCLPATAFTVGGNKTTSLQAGKPFTCVQIQPDGGSYNNSDVIVGSIVMKFSGGTVDSIFADATKSVIDGDRNGDGIVEIAACFRKVDLRLLFSGLPAGRNIVTVELEGRLNTGGSFCATLEHVVKSSGGALAASISPNPLNPRAKLTFHMSKPGAMKVQMFDLQGRLVKTLADESMAPAGYHDITIDGRNANGNRVASGLYFVKVWTQFDGSEVKSFTVLK